MQQKVGNAGIDGRGFYFGDPLTTGLPPEIQDMNFIEDIVPDSFVKEKDEDTIVDLKSQETSDIFMTLLSEVGTQKINFGTWNFKTRNIILALGGHADANGTWYSPVAPFVGIERSVAYITRVKFGFHLVFKFAKVLFRGKEEGIQQEGDGNKLQYTATILQPSDTNGNPKSRAITERVPAAPLGGIVDDTANTFAWTEVPEFVGFAKYEYTTDNGVGWNDCTANPQTGIVGAVPVGHVQVRVKGSIVVDKEYEAGFVLKSTEEFTV